ncbi:short chain dehydrogenase [Roseivirga misakiensis]|uniref:Short chain dehydrogenase n=1 Tax=Roseivirga misakiensis TaxID=1563681 RepID=A0A1E5T0V0_9BACT|nr:short chain dehydrogenase [Roseivirga misakiensis]OEK04986.1 short chain dehydrogenase [Roseivirga misakiensis]
MNILIIGANGTIGQKVTAKLAEKHTIITAGRNGADETVDIADATAIKDLFERIPAQDAVVCIAGEAKWDYFKNLTEEDFYVGVRSKMMGQVNLVRIGKDYLKPNASFTLSTGVLADDPVVMTTSAAMVNGAIHSFVKAAALEMENGQRINVVCSGLVEDSKEKYEDYFPGHDPVPMPKVVNAYVKSIMGKNNGEIIRVNA